MSTEKRRRSTSHLGPGEGHSLRVLGDVVTYKVTAEQTAGAFSVFEVTSPPGSGLPPHVHHRGDEFFYVLEGEYDFLLEGRVTRVGAGTSVYVTRGSLHSHRNVGEFPARMLVSHTPGRAHERFLEEIGRPLGERFPPPLANPTPSTEEIVSIAADYGIEIPPPEKRSRAEEPK